jgi:hypothetical protein
VKDCEFVRESAHAASVNHNDGVDWQLRTETSISFVCLLHAAEMAICCGFFSTDASPANCFALCELSAPLDEWMAILHDDEVVTCCGSSDS